MDWQRLVDQSELIDARHVLSWFHCGHFCLRDMLSVTLPISKKLQQANIEFMDAATIVRDALAVIKMRRSDCQYF